MLRSILGRSVSVFGMETSLEQLFDDVVFVSFAILTDRGKNFLLIRCFRSSGGDRRQQR